MKKWAVKCKETGAPLDSLDAEDINDLIVQVQKKYAEYLPVLVREYDTGQEYTITKRVGSVALAIGKLKKDMYKAQHDMNKSMWNGWS